MDLKEDKRFAHISKDPRFRMMSRKARKVNIDKRFEGMFTSKRFKLKYTVDKRGRPIQSTTNENLRKFYDISNSDEDSEDEESDNITKNQVKSQKEKTGKIKGKARNQVKSQKENTRKEKDATKLKNNIKNEMDDSKIEKDLSSKFSNAKDRTKQEKDNEESESSEVEEESSSKGEAESESESLQALGDSDESDDSDSGVSSTDMHAKKGVDLARGEGNVSSSSDESEEFDFEDDKFDHKWGEIDDTTGEAQEITDRLAVCNLDWDRIRAQDLYILFNSFKPATGVIKRVAIYPSDYGLQRMAEEDLSGPKELVEKEEQDDEPDEESDYNRERLRKYQLNRLKYYYAVVECDSPGTANHLYEQCDAMEFESSSTKIDLRFIPSDMTFDQKPKSIAKDAQNLLNYKPSQFCNSALQQSKVELTWDETDHRRKETLVRDYTKDDLEKMDLKDYLASSSEDDEDPYAGIEDPECSKTEKDVEKEKNSNKYEEIMSVINEGDDLKSKKGDTELQISWEPGLKESAEVLLKSKNKQETPWETFLTKKKEKRKKKKESKQNQDVAEKSGDMQTFSDDDIGEHIDFNDPYFKEEFDKVDTEPKSTKGKKKKKKGNKILENSDETEQEKQEKAALSLLVMDEDDNKQHFSLKSIQEQEKLESKKKSRKKKKKTDETPIFQDTFKIDANDPRFSEIYKNPLYNIDPSAPDYKATKSMEVLSQEKIRRRNAADSFPKATKRNREGNSDSEEVKPSKDASLSSLIKSVKAKAKTHQSKRSKLK